MTVNKKKVVAMKTVAVVDVTQHVTASRSLLRGVTVSSMHPIVIRQAETVAKHHRSRTSNIAVTSSMQWQIDTLPSLSKILGRGPSAAAPGPAQKGKRWRNENV